MHRVLHVACTSGPPAPSTGAMPGSTPPSDPRPPHLVASPCLPFSVVLTSHWEHHLHRPTQHLTMLFGQPACSIARCHGSQFARSHSSFQVHFFTERVIPIWNHLPHDVVTSLNNTVFRTRLRSVDPITHLYVISLSMFRQFVSARMHCATTCLFAYVCVFICMQSIKSIKFFRGHALSCFHHNHIRGGRRACSWHLDV